MGLFHMILRLYRRSLKRIPGVHRGFYMVGSYLILPAVEKWNNFWTIPDDPLYFRISLLLRKYESETVKFLKQYVKPGMVVLDVGAHVGYYTRLFSDLVGPSGMVIAFEPHPVHVHYLTRNIKNRSNVKVIPMAVGSQPGKTIIYDSPVISGGSSLAKFENKWNYLKTLNSSELAPRLRMNKNDFLEIEVIKIDDVLEDMGISKVDLMKIDIEGAEVIALQGARKTLERFNVKIVFELSPANLVGFGFSVGDLINTLHKYNYSTFGIICKGDIQKITPQELIELSHDLAKSYKHFNCVAYKEEYL